ncbi:MAG: response regulator transcription factor [Marinobacterium sp.]|nr:response regulator transcription factor [Marinobacterium sp.]
MHVLVVDDDPDILSTVMDHLELQGIVADCATNGQQAVQLATQQHYDVIVLDVMMPGTDGLSACRALRKHGSTVPILFLTARDTLDDKVDGFNAGGDDYLTKPFHIRELIMRINALSKRVSHHQVQTLSFGPLTLDLSNYQAHREGTLLQLTRLQFALLRCLVRHAPAVVHRNQLEQDAWGDDLPDSDALRTHIYQLRNVLDKPFQQRMLHTVRSQGFRLVDPTTDEQNHIS